MSEGPESRIRVGTLVGNGMGSRLFVRRQNVNSRRHLDQIDACKISHKREIVDHVTVFNAVHTDEVVA